MRCGCKGEVVKTKEQTLTAASSERHAVTGLFLAPHLCGKQNQAWPELFFLVTVLAKTFFTLVRGHLVTFSFLSAGHGLNGI